MPTEAQSLLLAGRLDALRAAIRDGGTHTEQWRRLYEQCQWYRDQQDPPKEYPDDTITYLGPAGMNRLWTDSRRHTGCPRNTQSNMSIEHDPQQYGEVWIKNVLMTGGGV